MVLPITKPATLLRVTMPSYGSLKIPTTHPTFLSESGISSAPTLTLTAAFRLDLSPSLHTLIQRSMCSL